MVLKAQILLRDRTIKEITVKEGLIDFEYQGGLYVIPSEYVREVPGKNYTETFYFVDNPTPINKNNEDRSPGYLGKIIIENYLKQINKVKSGGPSVWDSIKDILANPQAVVFILLAGIVLYAIYSSGGKLV